MALFEYNATIFAEKILLVGVATYALLDSGTTHSFIYESFVKLLEIFSENAESGFRVTVLSGEHMISTSMVKDVELKLQKNFVRADLIMLPMPDYDIISGMDWLTLNGSTIDFQQRSVSIRPPNGKSFIFEAVQNKQMPHIISYICSKKLISRGYQSFLASVIPVPDPGSRSIEDVEVVKDIPDVFSDDVSGVPPERCGVCY
ncbi:uncharacterized protein [Primulina eburnea]|uniref:uncharacterized protein n=1 Tax=Primulina eburnea TaxID=1245227 RepID=UPI003C6C6D5A